VNDDAQHELEIENNKSIKFRQDYEIQAKLCEKLNTDLFKRQFDLKVRTMNYELKIPGDYKSKLGFAFHRRKRMR